MAKFPPPANFDFSRPNEWPEWRARFERFRIATRLDQEDGVVQVSSLIYAMGREADKIFSAFNFAAVAEGENDPRDDFDIVLGKFDEHFVPKRNVIHERAKFYNRSQQAGESVEEFLRSLRELAATCDFRDREEESIRDRIVLGLQDSDVSQKLQLEAELDLKSAVDTARHYELVKAQIKDQRPAEKVDAAFSRGRFGWRGRGQARGGGRGDNKKPGFSVPRDCGKCGKSHPPANCPAKGKKCRKCGKFSHFAAMCRSGKSINNVAARGAIDYEEECAETFSLGAIYGAHTPEPPWTISLNFCGSATEFKIDTGADVSVISRSTYETLSAPPVLKPSKAVLRGPGGEISTKGEFNAQVRHKGKSCLMRCFVVNTRTDNLLSRDAAKHLGLVQRIASVQKDCDPLFAELDEKPANCKPVHISLKEDATPYSVQAARRVPIPLLQKVKEELDRLKSAQVIEEIQEPTDWCAGMVPVLKRNGAVRICIDYKQLNKNVRRERYMLPTLEDVLHKLHGAKVFSKLDCTSGFFQLPLDEESSKLTTFITPFGRYIYKRLPQGITSAPEIFQRTVEEILSDQPHTVCFFDDILVFSENTTDHKAHLEATKQKLRDAGLKLNKEKCELEKSELNFLGYHISGDGIDLDPTKVQAVTEMADPKNIEELRRFIGMVNFLGRHLPNLSTKIRPLTELLEKKNAWVWGPTQSEAVKTIKKLITTAPTLCFFDPSKPTVVSSDASSYGMGGVLLQEQKDGGMRPIAFCSRTLSQAERRYAQIEKECLAAVWCCERFDRYLVGLPTFQLETDHKPLIPLINNRQLSETPIRCQRMLMRLARFNAEATYTAGKNMHVADHLSRSPLREAEKSNAEEFIAERVNAVLAQWPASDKYLDRLREETRKDDNLQIVLDYTRNGWPTHKEDVKLGARHLFPVRGELSVWEGILVKGDRLLIPSSMRKEVLQRLHEGHNGINKCRERAADTVWWPHISQDVKDYISSCRYCLEKQPSQRKEPLISSALPNYPFERISADICELNNEHYLVVTDAYSRYLEIAYLPQLTSTIVINKLKNIFARHGIPMTVISDNGGQFSSDTFAQFAVEWNFNHKTSSPHYPQGNGGAEKAVQIAKNILRQKEVFKGILAYNATPIPELGASPAELAFGRKLRTTLPVHPQKYTPKIVSRDVLQQRDKIFKDRQKRNFDNHHGTQPLPHLHPGDPVLIKLQGEKRWEKPGEVVKEYAPRSYIVRTPSGELRRNRRHLRLAKSINPPLIPTHQQSAAPAQPIRQSGQPTDQGPPTPERSESAMPTVTPPTPAITSPGRYTKCGRKIVLPARFRDE